MEKLNTVTGKLIQTKRLNNSTMGNPNWQIIIEVDGQNWFYKTRSNASVGYEVSNYKIGSTVELSLSKALRVVFMKGVK